MFSDLRDYSKKHYRLILLSAVLAAAFFGVNAFTANIRIDTEELINEPGTTLGWLKIGRYGLVLLKRVLGLGTHQVFLSGLLFLVFFIISGILISFGMYYFSRKNEKYPYWMFALLYYSSCIWNYQFYFSLQQAEVALAMCLTAGAAFLTVHALFRSGGKQRRVWITALELLVSAALLLLCFGAYQALVTYYITLCISFFLVLFITETERGTAEKTGIYLLRAAGAFVHFGISFMIYGWIAKTWFTTTGYMENQVVWGTIGPVQCVKNIIKDVLHVLKNQGAENTSFYTAAAALFVISSIGMIRKKIFSGRDRVALYILVMLGLFASPFLMTVYAGIRPVTRTQFSLPVMSAVLAVFLFYFIKEYGLLPEKVLKYAGGGLLGLTLLLQISYDVRLQYTDVVRQREDAAQTELLLSKLKEAGNGKIPEAPVLFVGCKRAKLDRFCHRSEMYGWSFYEWDYSDAAPTGATHRIAGFVQAYSGVVLNQDFDGAMTDTAVSWAEGMKVFPEEGSIRITDELAVVKLSEVPWPAQDVENPAAAGVQGERQ